MICQRCNGTQRILHVPAEPLPVESIPCPECVITPYRKMLAIMATGGDVDKDLFLKLDSIMFPVPKQDKNDPKYLDFCRCIPLASFVRSIDADKQHMTAIVEALQAAGIPSRRQELTPIMQRGRKKPLPMVLFVNHADGQEAVAIYRKVTRRLKRKGIL